MTPSRVLPSKCLSEGLPFRRRRVIPGTVHGLADFPDTSGSSLRSGNKRLAGFLRVFHPQPLQPPLLSRDGRSRCGNGSWLRIPGGTRGTGGTDGTRGTGGTDGCPISSHLFLISPIFSVCQLRILLPVIEISDSCSTFPFPISGSISGSALFRILQRYKTFVRINCMQVPRELTRRNCRQIRGLPCPKIIRTWVVRPRDAVHGKASALGVQKAQYERRGSGGPPKPPEPECKDTGPAAE